MGHPEGAAGAAEIATDRPAWFLKHKRAALDGLLAFAEQHADGVFLRVVDLSGRRVLETSSTRATSSIWVLPRLQGCAPHPGGPLGDPVALPTCPAA